MNNLNNHKAYYHYVKPIIWEGSIENSYYVFSSTSSFKNVDERKAETGYFEVIGTRGGKSMLKLLSKELNGGAKLYLAHHPLKTLEDKADLIENHDPSFYIIPDGEDYNDLSITEVSSKEELLNFINDLHNIHDEL